MGHQEATVPSLDAQIASLAELGPDYNQYGEMPPSPTVLDALSQIIRLQPLGGTIGGVRVLIDDGRLTVDIATTAAGLMDDIEVAPADPDAGPPYGPKSEGGLDNQIN